MCDSDAATARCRTATRIRSSISKTKACSRPTAIYPRAARIRPVHHRVLISCHVCSAPPGSPCRLGLYVGGKSQRRGGYSPVARPLLSRFPTQTGTCTTGRPLPPWACMVVVCVLASARARRTHRRRGARRIKPSRRRKAPASPRCEHGDRSQALPPPSTCATEQLRDARRHPQSCAL